MTRPTTSTSADRTKPSVYRYEPNIRIRPLPEWAGALVYTPETPNMCYLNTTAWTVLELCEDKSPDELEEAFIEFVGEDVGGDEARQRLNEALTMLTSQRIVRLDQENGEGGEIQHGE